MENEYETIERHNLAEIQSLAIELRNLKNSTFARVSITSNVITINGRSVNLNDLQDWNFSMVSSQAPSDQNWKWKV